MDTDGGAGSGVETAGRLLPEQTVLVSLRAGVKPRMEGLRNFFHRQQPYVGLQKPVDRLLQIRQGNRVVQRYGRHLRQRMHSGIRSAGTGHVNRSFLDPREDVLERALYSRQSRLHLPSVEVGSVVGNGELDAAHPSAGNRRGSGARLLHWHSLRAERARLGRPGNGFECGQRRAHHPHIRPAAAPVNDGARRRYFRSKSGQHFDHFLGASPGGDHILNDNRGLPWINREAASEGHLSGSRVAFSEQKRDAQRPSHFMANDESAHGRGDNHVDGSAADLLDTGGQVTAEMFRVVRESQDPGTLEILPAVQTAGEAEMPPQIGSRGLEQAKHTLGCVAHKHILTQEPAFVRLRPLPSRKRTGASGTHRPKSAICQQFGGAIRME